MKTNKFKNALVWFFAALIVVCRNIKNAINQAISLLDWKWILRFYLINVIMLSIVVFYTGEIAICSVWLGIITISGFLAILDKVYEIITKQSVYAPANLKNENIKFDYKLSHEEGVEIFNQLQVGKEYEVLDLVNGEWKKQIYQPPNEQETYEKMIHGIRYGWIRIYKSDSYGGYFN